MKVKILDNISYQTYPITEDMIEIDVHTLKEIGQTKQFDITSQTIIPYTNTNDYILETNRIKQWFSTYYTEHEQKYQRLIRLNLLCDDGELATRALERLDEEAETKRRRIQELENLIGG